MFCTVTTDSCKISSNIGLANYVIYTNSCGLVLTPLGETLETTETLQRKKTRKTSEMDETLDTADIKDSGDRRNIGDSADITEYR